MNKATELLIKVWLRYSIEVKGNKGKIFRVAGSVLEEVRDFLRDEFLIDENGLLLDHVKQYYKENDYVLPN